MPINKKGNALYPPYTKEELNDFLSKKREEYKNKTEKENEILKYEIEKLRDRNFFLENLIEHTRQLWHKGERFSIKELLKCLKSGKITAEYQSLLDG